MKIKLALIDSNKQPLEELETANWEEARDFCQVSESRPKVHGFIIHAPWKGSTCARIGKLCDGIDQCIDLIERGDNSAEGVLAIAVLVLGSAMEELGWPSERILKRMGSVNAPVSFVRVMFAYAEWVNETMGEDYQEDLTEDQEAAEATNPA